MSDPNGYSEGQLERDLRTLARLRAPSSLSPEELQELWDSLPSEPLSQEEIERILNYVQEKDCEHERNPSAVGDPPPRAH